MPKSHFRLCLLLLLGTLLLAGWPTAGRAQSTMSPSMQLISQSPYVFRCKVLEISGKTAGAPSRVGQLLTVRVTEVYREPNTTTTIAAGNVEIRTAGNESFRRGQEILFAATAWAVSDRVELQEVEHLSGEAQRGGELERALDSHWIREQRLQEEINVADIVVVGRVARIVAAPEGRHPISEHDPKWAVATIEVRNVLKGGQQNQSSVDVAFPTSRDIAFVGYLRPQILQAGIWILHRQVIDGTSTDRFLAPNLIDFQSADHVKAIQQIASGKKNLR
jgi:hypothetical protein